MTIQIRFILSNGETPRASDLFQKSGGVRTPSTPRSNSTNDVSTLCNRATEDGSNPDLSGACTGEVTMRRTWVFASERLPGMMRLGCRQSLGLIKARRNLSLLPLTSQPYLGVGSGLALTLAFSPGRGGSLAALGRITDR